MSFYINCQENRKTPILDERTCPVCGKDVEVFVRDGRLIDDFTCSCGHVLQREEPLRPARRGEREAE